MSKYKIGDKVYLECEVIGRDAFDNTYKLIYENHVGNCVETNWTNSCKLHTLNEVDESYNKGLNDAWELAKKIVISEEDGGYSLEELRNIFGYGDFESILKVFTPQEALAKVKDYEEKCNEIKVGDVVKDLIGESLVLRIDDNRMYLLCRDRSCGECSLFYHYKKTGKHFDSIDEFMRSTDD